MMAAREIRESQGFREGMVGEEETGSTLLTSLHCSFKITLAARENDESRDESR
jgi:hypothetical protein